jgi:serine/threonine-protein kinase
MQPARADVIGSKSPDILPTGAVIDGKYLIERKLGSGAMGAVFQAVHTGTGRKVALKVVTGELAREDLIRRFQREARAAGVIETQHITQVLDTGVVRQSGLPFLVMELLAGEDFSHLLKRVGPVSPDLALRVVAQSCLGLQKAHEANVVHRDIKPANLFLARRDAGEVIIKLLDFGIAKVKMDHAQETDSAAMTRTGSMLGSPLYMSPEQARGLRDIDHRTDIWSLGIVLYQALTGQTPYHHITALGELIIAICSTPPRPIQEVAPWVPRDIAAIVHWALRIDRNERFPAAQAMFAAIRTLLPYGWNIGEEMLVPLHETLRRRVEPTLSASQLSGPAPAGASSSPGGMVHPLGNTGQPALAGSSPGGGNDGSRTMVLDPSATASALTHSQIGQQRPSKLPIVAGVVALGVLMGGGAYVAMRRSPKAAEAPAKPEMSAAPPAVATEAAPTVAPDSSAAADLQIERRVKLVIEPEDASVEVDGQPVIPEAGIVELTGGLGTTKRVRVFKAGVEATEDVAITDSGALPPKVKIAVVPSGGGRNVGAAPAPRSPGTGAAAAPPPQAPVAPSGIKDKFE